MAVQNPYEKVVKKFLTLVALLVFSPILFSVALKAKKIYTEGIGLYVSYTLLVIGGLLLLFTVYFGFRTIQALLDTLFRDKE